MLSTLFLLGSLVSPLFVVASSSAPPPSYTPPAYVPPPPAYSSPSIPSPSGGANPTSTYPAYGSDNSPTYRICPDRKPGHQDCIYPRNVLKGYEYIVIGSGIGGGPVAANLARKGHSVLLLEAGTDQHEKNLNVTVPLFNFASSEDPKVSWSFFVTHYDDPKRAKRDPKLVYETLNGTQHTGPGAPAGSKIKGIFYPRGATIGGSGAHNALVNIYPHATDWDNIANLTNDNSWNSNKMRRYWEGIEHTEYLSPGAEGHGYKGWLHTNRMAYNVFKDSKFTNQMMAAAEVAGNPVKTLRQLLRLLRRDVNAPSRIRDEEKGLYSFPLFMKGSRRSSVANFVMDTFHAKNEDGTQKYPLHIRTNCLATKLIFDQTKSPPKAIGVEFLDGESLYRADPRAGSANVGTPGVAYTNKEVILSGGAYNSPQILKLSGIGPAEELNKFNIPVVVNSPGVGRNLQDRYECSVVSKTDAHFTPYETCTGGHPGDPCLEEWRNNPTNTSIYATMGVVGGIFDRSKYATNVDDDLFVFGGAYINRGYFPGYSVVANKDTKHWTWMILKAHTGNNAGHVNLRSADPRAVPDINFNYFDFGTADAADADAGAVAQGVKISRQIMDTYAKRYPYANQYTEVLPGRHVKTDAQIKQYVQDQSWGHHASCTNRMGPDSDPMAVVNSKFQVRGVSGLRIVDASVFPHIPGVFIAAPTYIMSAKASDVIAQDAEDSCNV